MSLWLFLLRRFFIDPDMVAIYQFIAISLLLIVIPCLLGLVLSRVLPKLATVLTKINRILIALFLIFIMTYGIYANLYIAELIADEPAIIPAPAVTPLVGFILSYLTAYMYILQQPHRTRIAIAIETAIQNPAIAILILQSSFPQPDGDRGAVIPVIMKCFTPLLLVTSLCILLIHRCVSKTKSNPEVVHTETLFDARKDNYDKEKCLHSENYSETII